MSLLYVFGLIISMGKINCIGRSPRASLISDDLIISKRMFLKRYTEYDKNSLVMFVCNKLSFVKDIHGI